MINKIVINNLVWQILDKVILLILQFFVGVKIANYFGKEIYGTYSYALSIIIFSEIIYELINKRVVILYFLKRKNINLLKAISIFKGSLGFLFFIGVLINKNNIGDFNLYIILIFLSASEIFKNLYFFYEVYYEANLNSKPFIVIVNIIKILSYICQYISIIFYHEIIFIPLFLLIENILKVMCLKIFFKYGDSLKNQKYKMKYYIIFILYIIKRSFYFWIGYIYFLVFTQIDKIMIGNMLSKSEHSCIIKNK